MPSHLLHLKKQLRWNDFGTPRHGAPPAAGQVAPAAQTRTNYRRVVNFDPVPHARPPQLRLRDDVSIDIYLEGAKTWVMQWVFQRPQPFQDSLLHHEQGHYDLVALFCRDLFIEIMALKPRTFSNGNAALQAVNGLFRRYDRLIDGVHKPYDDDTHHGLVAAQQRRWDGFIHAAFTRLRNPPMHAPDGTPYKVPLEEVLRQGGVTI